MIHWPTYLLQALRTGRWRLACAMEPLAGRTFAQLRRELELLSDEQRWALHSALCGGIGLAPAVRDQRAARDLTPAMTDAVARGLPAHDEAVLLQATTRDRFGRRHWLQPVADRAWSRMRGAAQSDGVELELISSFRSFDDQCRILRRKLRQGQDWPLILAVSAAPGFSEHHTGCAVDLATPGQPPLTEDFERTPAFAWLSANAGNHDFHLSYPRDNRWGFVYEPWHWCYQPRQWGVPQLA